MENYFFSPSVFLLKLHRLNTVPLGSHRGITVASTVDHELFDCEFDRDEEKILVDCVRFAPSRNNDQCASMG